MIFESGVAEEPIGADDTGPVLRPAALLAAEDNVELDNGKGTEGEALEEPLLSPLIDVVAAVRLDMFPLDMEAVPVVNREVVGLGGIVNGCGGPGTELVDDVVILMADVEPYGVPLLLVGDDTPLTLPGVVAEMPGVVVLVLGIELPD